MEGILYSVIAGVCISLQGVFNAKLVLVLSTWHTTTIVHLVGFITALIIFIFIRDEKLKGFREVPWIYFLGGIFGIVIVIGEMLAINMLGVTLAVVFILLSQLIFAFIIEMKGFFGVVKLQVNLQQILGVCMILTGVIIFNS